MPVTDCPEYIHEPDSLQCGQTVLAMLSGKSVDEIVALTGVLRETKLSDVFSALDSLQIGYRRVRTEVRKKEELPEICILSLETPRCWHWSLYYKGTFYDPEHGVLDDFPESKRKYFWEITGI